LSESPVRVSELSLMRQLFGVALSDMLFIVDQKDSRHYRYLLVIRRRPALFGNALSRARFPGPE
jgi:hypothetical protein